VTDRRVAAARAVASQTGRSVAEVLATLAPTWGISGLEVARLQFLASLPTAPTVATTTRSAARAEADQHRVTADGLAVSLSREHAVLKTQNPFAAAQMMNRHADEIMRGREIDSDPNSDPTPEPQAA